MIRPYVTRYDIDRVLKCVTENPDYDVTQIQRKTYLNHITINECLKQLEEHGIISNVEN